MFFLKKADTALFIFRREDIILLSKFKIFIIILGESESQFSCSFSSMREAIEVHSLTALVNMHR